MEYCQNKYADDNASLFVCELVAHRKQIYAFIMTLVANSNDADDIFQETASFMWRKYPEMEKIENFAAWGIRIAHYKVLEFRKKHYNKKIQFSDDLLDKVIGGAVSVNENIDDRYVALKKCIAKLEPWQKKLLLLRHQKGWTVKSIATELKQAEASVYKKIPRLHDIIARCIHQTLRAEEAI